MEVSLKPNKTQKSSETPPTSENETQIEPIEFDDIFKYYDFEPANIKEKEVAEIIRQNKKNMIQRMINRLNRELPKISQFLPDFSPLEYYIAFDLGNGDPETIILKSCDKDFIKEVKYTAKDKISLLDPRVRQKRLKQLAEERERELNQEEEEEEDNEDDRQSESETDSSSDLDSDSEDSDKESRRTSSRHITTRNHKKESSSSGSKPGEKLHITHRHHRVRDQSKKSDLPLPEGVDQKVWHKWSTIHQASYLAGIQNPNTYFYRNVAPGEKQKNGPWSAEEKKLFLKRLDEVRQQGSTKSQWGIFSQAIPGRVGYQCANFYRKLIANKEIEDPSYFTDEDGILRHKKVINEDKYAKKKRGSKDDEPQLSLYEKRSQENPLVGAIDSITNEKINVPAMSPGGYILDYKTWTNIINNKDAKDPFTMTHINKRQLIILNNDNIDEYRDKIKNLEFSQS